MASELSTFLDDTESADVILKAEQAIAFGVFPERIPQSSSGSYFVKDLFFLPFFFSFLHLSAFKSFALFSSQSLHGFPKEAIKLGLG